MFWLKMGPNISYNAKFSFLLLIGGNWPSIDQSSGKLKWKHSLLLQLLFTIINIPCITKQLTVNSIINKFIKHRENVFSREKWHLQKTQRK